MIAPLRSIDEITLVHGFLDFGATTAVVLGWYGVVECPIVPDPRPIAAIAGVLWLVGSPVLRLRELPEAPD